MSRLIAGIDPGLEGCVAVLDFDGPTLTDLECHNVPTYDDGDKRRVDIGACAHLLRDLKADGIGHVFIEKVNAGVWSKKSKDGKPQSMGVTSAFTFGQGYGVWLGILAALEIPHTLVSPQAWKKNTMPGEAKEKDASRVVAMRMWPTLTEEWLRRKKDHNRADAILLAEHGRRTLYSSSGLLDG